MQKGAYYIKFIIQHILFFLKLNLIVEFFDSNQPPTFF